MRVMMMSRLDLIVINQGLAPCNFPCFRLHNIMIMPLQVVSYIRATSSASDL